jgi:hypothetical protein
MDSQGKFIDFYTSKIRYRGVQKACGMACFSQMASSIDKWQNTSSKDNPRKMIDFLPASNIRHMCPRNLYNCAWLKIGEI